MENKPIQIATHSGGFHTDELFAIAILKRIYSDIEIIRTRIPEKYERADLRIDVGEKYNPETGDFDHHQKEFTDIREDTKIPYASAGIVWKHYGRKLVNTDSAFTHIDRKLIQPIDASDNGFNLYDKEISPYTINNIIGNYYPDWQDETQDYDKGFFEALEIAEKILDQELVYANSMKVADDELQEAVENTDKEYVVLDRHLPNFYNFLLDYPKIKYIIYPSSGGSWNSKGARIMEGSFEMRKPFPEKWAGLRAKELAEITGVSDAIFCHKARFIVSAKSKEGVIKLVELALED